MPKIHCKVVKVKFLLWLAIAMSEQLPMMADQQSDKFQTTFEKLIFSSLHR